MRYRLSVSSAEASARIRGAVLGEYWASRRSIREAGAKAGFYGTVERDRFQIVWSDGGIAATNRQTPAGMLHGRITDAATGCEMDVQFRLDALIWGLAIFFGIGILVASAIAITQTDGRAFALLWIAVIVILSLVFSAIFKDMKNQNFRKLEALFSDCIMEKEKN